MRTGCRLDKLASNTQAIARPTYTSFQHVAHAKLLPHMPYVHGATFVRKGRVAGNYEQPADPGERSYDVLYQAIDKVLLLGVAAHVIERQHGERRFVGQRQYPRRRLVVC